MRLINTICVCGAGTMGSGIAQCAAKNGLYTTLFDVRQTIIDKAKSAIEKSIAGLVTKNKISTQEGNAILQRLTFTTDINDCIADVIIEAIVEKLEIKISLLNQLAEVNHSETIFATNTSSLSVQKIAAGVMHPSRVIGMHFFNPATIMKLVEVVKAPQTIDDVVNAITALCKQLGKTAVQCIDSPGFIVNRVARPFYIEALRIAEEGETSFATIDTLMQATGFKMGPFKLMDLIGNDINYAVSCSVYNQLGQPERLQPSYIQQQKVESGELGVKTGKGYYDYTI